jgi:hypothetical protein
MSHLIILNSLITNKNCLKYDIDDFKTKLKLVDLDQSRILDLKINFQQISEKTLAYFRANSKPERSNPNFDIQFCKSILKKCEKLHYTGVNLLKINDTNSRLIKLLKIDENLYSDNSESSDEGNLTIELNDAPYKVITHKPVIRYER